MLVTRRVFVPRNIALAAPGSFSCVVAEGGVSSGMQQTPCCLRFAVFPESIAKGSSVRSPWTSYIERSYIEPSYIEPSYIEPSYIEPSYIEPSYIEPSYIEPSYIEPSYIEPSYIEPSYIEPSYIEP